MKDSSGLTIAVAGAGVAGIVAAWLLGRRHRVTLFEKNDYVGGHTRTLTVDDNGRKLPVDTGFIVFNDRTYPRFIRFIEELGVERQKSPMAFSYTDTRSGFCYSSKNPFADPANRLRPRFWLFLAEIVRFNSLTRRLLRSGGLQGLSLSQYLARRRFSQAFRERYILPMGAAIWSTPDRAMEAFPAETFARFFENHGLLTLTRHPQWYTIKGGSHEYVRAFLRRFSGTVCTGGEVRKIIRDPDKVRLYTDAGGYSFDAVVIAAHADEALAMLADPTDEEARLLSKWRYTKNRVLLHRDDGCLPALPAARASWNYVREADPGQEPALTMTYYMNQLQQLPTDTPYCVTLNPRRPVAPEHLIADLAYSHPHFTAEAVGTQAGLPALNGRGRTWFCGSYFRYGFHEDAVRSAAEVGEQFGIFL